MPSFCKCTCGKNSTIISLDFETSESLLLRDLPASQQLSSAPPNILAKKAAASACAKCTKAFCLSQKLDICKDTKEEDVVTSCFQRDSNKDKIIVWGFIIGTVGLLSYALYKRIRQWRETGSYASYQTMGIGAR